MGLANSAASGRAVARVCSQTLAWSTVDSNITLFTSCSSAPRMLVLGPSTRLEFRHIFACPKQPGCRLAILRRQFLVELLEFRLGPAYAIQLDFSFRRNPEQGGNIGQPIAIGHGIFAGFIERERKRYAVLARESLSVAGVVLRDTDNRRLLVAVCLEQPLDVRKGELAHRTTHLEKCRQHRASFARLRQGERLGLLIQWKFEFRRDFAGNERRHIPLLKESD